MITCQFEDGGKASLRHVTVNAIVVKNNQVLLGKRGTHKGKKMLESGKWSLLGGFFDRDEFLEEAVKREVLEESGWQIDKLKLLRINDNPNRPAEDRQNVDIIFMAEAVKQVGSTDEEVTHLKWFDLDGLPPKEKVAFDHYDSLIIYQKHLTENLKLPILGKINF